MKNEILDAAKKYCEKHLFIIPVGKNKVPHTLHGLKDATNDYNQFLKLYKEGDQIAMLTGEINNLYVADLDVEKDSNHAPILKNGQVINTGEQNFINKFIDQENAEKFKTRTIKTQSGGKQLYYRLKDGQKPLKTHTGIKVLPKVDLKGSGGYVVVPPSEGQYGKYESIGDLPVTYMPDELYQFWHDLELPDDSNEPIVPINFNDSTLSLLIKTIADIFKHPNGRGNELLMALAGAMALRGVSIAHTKEIIKEAAKLNHWSKIDYGVIDNSYNKVKNNQKVLGFTTFKNDIIENKENYEDFNGIIKNLEYIFEHHESPFYDVDDRGVKKFDKEKSIKFVRKKYPDLYTDDTDVIYYFSIDDGWHEGVEPEIASFIQGIDESLSEHNIKEIIAGLKHLTFDNKFKSSKLPNTLIPITGGLYNVVTKTLEPHNKNYFYKNIERKYIPGASQQAFDDFLNKVLVNPDKDMNTVYESISWALLNDNNIQGMVIFYGEGGNGKGIIQNDVIANLLGRENVAMPDLNRIANYPFELQSLANKRALLFSESIKGVTYNWEILKRITGHDYENIPIKNKPAILSQYQSAVILSTNQLIPPKDELAIWRRIINIVEFNNYLNSLGSSEISKIVGELTNPGELDKLFSFILDNIYPKFLVSGFSCRYNLKTAKEKYLMKSNPAITYLSLKEKKGGLLIDSDDVMNYCKNHGLDQNNCISTNRDGTITVFEIKSALIKQVNQFCNVNHLPKYDEQDRNSQTKLGQAIHYLDLEVSEFRKRINGKPIHAWSGIFVTPDEEDIKIDDNEGSIPEIPDPSKNPEGRGTLETGKDNGNTGKQEPETDDEKKEEKPGDEDTVDNPPDNSPAPNKAGQNEANKKEENKEHKSEKTPRIPKNPKMYCYQIMDHFDSYPDSYFDGSDIILDSYRPIYHKNSSNLSYILLKVLIPDNLSQQPGNWMKFLSDSQEISQKQFEVLSKGDSQ